MPSEPGATPPARRRRRGVVSVVLMAVAAAVAGAILATGGGGQPRRGSPPTAAGAARVERRTLVTSREAPGKIRYANSATVADRLRGTLTWVPAVGRVIDPGQRLFDVDDFPVILMDGTTPAYRTLDASDTPGPDVRQLNADLIALGFDPGGIVDDDAWQPATTDGVDAFQQAHGMPETGSLALGTVVFLSGAQRVAGLQGGGASVSDDAGEAGDDAGEAGEGEGEVASDPLPSPAGGAADAAISRLQRAVRELQRQDQRLARAVAAVRSHRSQAPPSSGSRSSGAHAGPVSGGDSAVLTTTSTNLVVTVDVAAGEQGVTRVGARVPVIMPSGNPVHGRVVAIGQATSAGGGSQVPITIHLEQHENGRDLDQATVSVRFVERTARRVLSVPITALLARPGGRYAVQLARAPYRLIDVRLGAFATGYVQVSGRGLRPGLRVTDSQG